MKIIGLDVSSSKVGIALLEDGNIVISEVLKFKTGLSLEERAAIFEKRMSEIERNHVVFEVYVEQPAISFRGGKTTAFTMATLQRFNGMCSYILYDVFEVNPFMVNPRSARSRLGIKIPKKVSTKEVKNAIIEHVEQLFDGDFSYTLTHRGNPKPGTDDRADAIVVALAGPILAEQEAEKTS